RVRVGRGFRGRLVDLAGAIDGVRGELQLDDQLSVVLLGAGEHGNDSGAHYRWGRRCADSFECCWSSTSRGGQQHLYDWQACPDAYLHRGRLVLYQPALVRIGCAASDWRVFSIGSVAALRIHWIRDGRDSRRRNQESAKRSAARASHRYG